MTTKPTPCLPERLTLSHGGFGLRIVMEPATEDRGEFGSGLSASGFCQKDANARIAALAAALVDRYNLVPDLEFALDLFGACEKWPRDRRLWCRIYSADMKLKSDWCKACLAVSGLLERTGGAK